MLSYTLLVVNIAVGLLVFAHVVDMDRTSRRYVMATQDVIDAVVAQLGKAKTELLGRIEQLQADLAHANVTVDVSQLVAAAQALDDIVPDAEPAAVEDEPVEEPVEVEPVEEPVEDETVVVAEETSE